MSGHHPEQPAIIRPPLARPGTILNLQPTPRLPAETNRRRKHRRDLQTFVEADQLVLVQFFDVADGERAFALKNSLCIQTRLKWDTMSPQRRDLRARNIFVIDQRVIALVFKERDMAAVCAERSADEVYCLLQRG
jgi:hypothetical protein